MSSKEKNVFISHYGKNDEHIGKLKDLLGKKGYTLKNSSIDSTKPNEASNPEYIKSLLRSRIQWAGTTVVLIGPKTHTREWVNYEIEQSNKSDNTAHIATLQHNRPTTAPDQGRDAVGRFCRWDCG